MASRSSSWLLVGSLVLVVTAASASCGTEKKRPPSLTSSTTSTTTTTTGAGGTGGDATGGMGGMGGMAGATGTGGAPDTCSNKEKDDDETDIDCGGPCAGCGTGKGCVLPADCVSKNCQNGVCAQASCSDGIQNGIETDIDCGGGPGIGCAFCGPGKKCNNADDCDSSVCTGGLCVKASCSDGVLNGSETDIDCGGADCPHCPLNKHCIMDADCATSSCNESGNSVCVCPLGTVVVPVNGGTGYCIDATEVTYLQYQEFQSIGIPPNSQPASCSWNNTATPAANWGNWQANGKGSFPVTNVNWCQAYMYCQFKGKHLCGKIGGGPNAQADHANALKSEWYNACSAQGTSNYPYNNMYMPGICNGENCLGTLAESDVGIKLCEGGQPMLQQMSGNAAEWEDSCDADTGGTDQCQVRGGSDCSNMNGLRCDADVTHARNFSDDHTGFRCCL
ncbi:MAG: SUMF1/EgtB/PvdO family nonheme iron enzyme [Byssovorax sp.]